MQKDPSTLKFDYKEVVVLFSLFVFVSLLMFTVGILVGKGLTQAKYEGKFPSAHAEKAAPHRVAEAKEEVHEEPKVAEAPKTAAQTAPTQEEKLTDNGLVVETKVPLNLIPKTAPPAYVSLKEPNREADKVLTNPKLKSVIEDGPTPHKVNKEKLRSPASLPNLPQSKESGKFTVQVGSYSNEKDAKERIELLKKLGFPHAFLSAKPVNSSTTWYRVWLGYYEDFANAKQAGETLQQRGEVKNYLVRKSTEITG